ncbi:MAG: hypothetical protein LBL26_00805 [Peptococcaceae bacterium]|nr:hypothetical protein [Peptococcaceae bacterium]
MKKKLLRRNFLKYGAAIGTVALVAAVLAGCGSAVTPSSGAESSAVSSSGTSESLPSVQATEPGAIKQSYYRVSGANIMLYEPIEPGENAKILLASMHGGLGRTLEQNFLKTVATLGFRTMYCVPDHASFVDQFKDFANCMTFAREYDGVTKIILMGQSRGAAVMSAYQKIAENGADVFQGPERRLPIPDIVCSPADGLMLLDANFGFMVMHVMSMNPALIEEGNAMKVDPELDALNPENGFGEEECHYTEEFRRKFLTAQRSRYYELMDLAEERWGLIQNGEGNFSDNEPFIVPDCIGTNNSPKLFAGDISYFSRTKGAYDLIHPDGSITNEVIRCLRPNENNPAFAGTKEAAFETTVKDFFWMEVNITEDYDYGEDYLTGVDFESSFTCSSGNVKMISCPLLLMGHTAGYEFITAEWSYENANSADKTIAFTEGATHGWSSIDKDKYGDTLLTEAKYVADWMTAEGRFVD